MQKYVMLLIKGEDNEMWITARFLSMRREVE
jgi:hypothetical protein